MTETTAPVRVELDEVERAGREGPLVAGGRQRDRCGSSRTRRRPPGRRRACPDCGQVMMPGEDEPDVGAGDRVRQRAPRLSGAARSSSAAATAAAAARGAARRRCRRGAGVASSARSAARWSGSSSPSPRPGTVESSAMSRRPRQSCTCRIGRVGVVAGRAGCGGTAARTSWLPVAYTTAGALAVGVDRGRDRRAQPPVRVRVAGVGEVAGQHDGVEPATVAAAPPRARRPPWPARRRRRATSLYRTPAEVRWVSDRCATTCVGTLHVGAVRGAPVVPARVAHADGLAGAGPGRPRANRPTRPATSGAPGRVRRDRGRNRSTSAVAAPGVGRRRQVRPSGGHREHACGASPIASTARLARPCADVSGAISTSSAAISGRARSPRGPRARRSRRAVITDTRGRVAEAVSSSVSPGGGFDRPGGRGEVAPRPAAARRSIVACVETRCGGEHLDERRSRPRPPSSVDARRARSSGRPSRNPRMPPISSPSPVDRQRRGAVPRERLHRQVGAADQAVEAEQQRRGRGCRHAGTIARSVPSGRAPPRSRRPRPPRRRGRRRRRRAARDGRVLPAVDHDADRGRRHHDDHRVGLDHGQQRHRRAPI